MNDSGVKIEVHLIQNFAPSNLNRDDTGQPKSATFGGFRRARVSSQCGKRAAREWWRERGTATVGDRTLRLQQLIGDTLAKDKEFTKKVADVDHRKAGIRVFTDTYYAAANKDKPDKTNVLIFIGPDEVGVCARAIKEIWDDEIKNKTELKPRKEIESRIKEAQVSADIALFGRMLAEQPGRNTDGACQVAHPISTHKVDMEMDFYTAVDDLNPEEETGAGMMGVVGFNSACYYRYALVDRDQLARNLARKTERKDGKWAQQLEAEDYDAADNVIKAFLEAMVYAIPTGKQNSFAAQNLPSFGLFVRRQGGVPISLANAFAKPVRPTKDDDDLVGLSVDRLSNHWEEIKKVYGEQGAQTTACFHLEQKARLNGLSGFDKESVQRAMNAVMEANKP
jgi:CRISPR system Cascade subunit CasC